MLTYANIPATLTESQTCPSSVTGMRLQDSNKPHNKNILSKIKALDHLAQDEAQKSYNQKRS